MQNFRLYTLVQRERHCHVRLARGFTIALRTMMPLWAEILDSGDNRAVRRVLVEGDAPLRDMRARDAFKHGEFIAGIDRPGIRAALCLGGYVCDEVTRVFLETANNGISQIRFFDDQDDAQDWLDV